MGLVSKQVGRIFEIPLYKTKIPCYNGLVRCTGGSMDRASDSGSEGWGFESLPVYQKSRYPFGYLLFCILRGRDSNMKMQQSGGLLLDAGSTASTP